MDVFRFQINPPWTDLPRCNAVLNGKIGARAYTVDRYRTTLCVKSVTRGSAVYRTRQGRYLIEDGCFLVLNDGQEYSLEIAAGSFTETLCPFFQPGFLGHVARILESDPARELDDPEPAGDDPGFYERLYPDEGPVAARLRALAAGLRSPEASGAWLEDHLYGLAGDLVGLRSRVRREVAAFPGSRPSTREELYRRLHRARDYLDSCFAEKLTVEQVARAACLSPYHFHRTFKRAFGETPMRWLQARRLRAAARLLARTDRPVTAVCLDVGFDSLGTFSWLFRKRFGLAPSDFRALHRPR
jgi:AraC-like DNA-binding protein